MQGLSLRHEAQQFSYIGWPVSIIVLLLLTFLSQELNALVPLYVTFVESAVHLMSPYVSMAGILPMRLFFQLPLLCFWDSHVKPRPFLPLPLKYWNNKHKTTHLSACLPHPPSHSFLVYVTVAGVCILISLLVLILYVDLYFQCTVTFLSFNCIIFISPLWFWLGFVVVCWTQPMKSYHICLTLYLEKAFQLFSVQYVGFLLSKWVCLMWFYLYWSTFLF